VYAGHGTASVSDPAARKTVNESYRQRVIREKLARSDARRPEALPTGFNSLDAATGGMPRGGIVELFGDAGSGKTTLALQIAANVQAAGGSAVWVDAEHCFDAAYAMRLGVAMDRLPVAQPDSAEEALEIMRRLAESAAVDLLVVDSAAALVPQVELEAGIAASGAGLHSRVLASGLRRLAAAIRRSGSVALFLNQTRTSTARGGEDAGKAAGGPPLKLFAATRLAILGDPRRTRSVVLRVLKNKAAGAPSECRLVWRNDAGLAEAP
jgi:recombination protein RecA